jgi:5S rRNA maturation endonuclease (ribonuclease M5)
VRIVPFKLPDLIEAISTDKTVFIVEGEKDVLNLRAQGVPATCNPMGAGKWREDFNTIFRGADVVICGDNDEPGRDHVRKIAQSLHGIAGRLRVLDLAKFWPEIEPSSDVSDFLQHHTVEVCGTSSKTCRIGNDQQQTAEAAQLPTITAPAKLQRHFSAQTLLAHSGHP